MAALTLSKQKINNSMSAFWFIWIGQVFSALGSQIAGFAMTWYLTERTGSATILAAAMGAQIIPQVILAPVAGAFVDRWNRRLVMMGADGLGALVTLVLVVLFSMDSIQIWQILALMFVRASAGIFHWAAFQSTTPLMVPPQHLARIGGLNAALSGISGIAAPALGALLIGITTMEVILSLDVLTAVIAISPLLFVYVPQPERAAASVDVQQPSSLLSEMKEGFRYLWQWPGLRMVVLLAVIVNLLFTPTFSLLPILVTQRFEGGVADLALIQGAWAVGIAAGGIVLGAWGGFKRRIVTSMLGLALMALGTLVVGASPAGLFPLAVAGMLVAGFMHPMVNGPLFAILQSIIPAELQGRVLTLVVSLGSAMVPLSLALAGPLSDAAGSHIWYLISGVLTLAVAAAGVCIKAVMHIEEVRSV